MCSSSHFEHVIFVVLSFAIAPSIVQAGSPRFDSDPYGDADFHEVPLILNNTHPTTGRAEVAVMYSNSVVDRYTAHAGLALDFNYHFAKTLGVSMSAALFNGRLTGIVASENGVLGQKALADSGDLTPNLPDFKQVTSYLSAALLWSPLYGKISIVSEIDLSLQVYGFAGLGINGLRTPNVQRSSAAEFGYVVTNSGFGADGFFSDMRVNGSLGVGVRIYLLDWLSARAELRTLSFMDKFDFDNNGQEDSYLSSVYFAQFGLAAVLF